ncbi:MAG: terminase family protein, partial [Alphaproteobacteria bacterium]|nr:terminase family protein [Alphaproteobacteria bacterium]
MSDVFRTLVEKSNSLNRSELLQLLKISVTVNSMLNKVIGGQKNQCNKKVVLSGIPSDGGENADKDAENLVDWEQIARKNQLMPEGDWRIWMILAGRGFGKTRAAAEAIRKLALSGKYRRIALIANTIEEAKQVMVEGVSGLQNISRDSDGLSYTPSRRELCWKNGAIATLYGAENYQQLRGPQFDLAWIDEFAKFLHPRET